MKEPHLNDQNDRAIKLPPIPVANDFRDHSGYVSTFYHDALRAWKEVCLEIVKTKAVK